MLFFLGLGQEGAEKKRERDREGGMLLILRRTVHFLTNLLLFLSANYRRVESLFVIVVKVVKLCILQCFSVSDFETHTYNTQAMERRWRPLATTNFNHENKTMHAHGKRDEIR